MSDQADDFFPVAQLIPVSEWEFYLYRVEYFYRADDEKPTWTKYLVSTDTHIDGEIQEYAPNDHWTRYMEHEIGVVRRPRQVGTVHGMRMDESAIEAGQREARARGLVA